MRKPGVVGGDRTDQIAHRAALGGLGRARAALHPDRAIAGAVLGASHGLGHHCDLAGQRAWRLVEHGLVGLEHHDRRGDPAGGCRGRAPEPEDGQLLRPRPHDLGGFRAPRPRRGGEGLDLDVLEAQFLELGHPQSRARSMAGEPTIRAPTSDVRDSVMSQARGSASALSRTAAAPAARSWATAGKRRGRPRRKRVGEGCACHRGPTGGDSRQVRLWPPWWQQAGGRISRRKGLHARSHRSRRPAPPALRRIARLGDRRSPPGRWLDPRALRGAGGIRQPRRLHPGRVPRRHAGRRHGPGDVHLFGRAPVHADHRDARELPGPGPPGALYGEGQVVQAGKSIAFLEGRLMDLSGTVVARATASARLVSSTKALAA